MEFLIRLDLIRPFLVARALASKPELQNIIGIGFVGLLLVLGESILNNFFHVCALGPDDPSSNLKFLLVFYLDVVPAGQLALFRIVTSIGVRILVFLLFHIRLLGPLDFGVIILQDTCDWLVF